MDYLREKLRRRKPVKVCKYNCGKCDYSTTPENDIEGVKIKCYCSDAYVIRKDEHWICYSHKP